jgi:carbon-monoxide dehydrogenase small subunit
LPRRELAPAGNPEGSKMDKHPLELNVNGRGFRLAVEHRKTLADTIREDCGLTGTHVGCEHGVCGACTVIVDGLAVRSCLMFAHQADGSRIRTVESLADGEKLHPIQTAFIENHALQCGFCTPGFLMLIVAAFEKDPEMADQELIEILSSNLCRCTGYQNIMKAVRAAAPQLASPLRVRTP